MDIDIHAHVHVYIRMYLHVNSGLGSVYTTQEHVLPALSIAGLLASTGMRTFGLRRAEAPVASSRLCHKLQQTPKSWNMDVV